MTRLSSIFSFSTLNVRLGVPRTLLVALLVVAGVEGVVRYRHAQRDSNFGHSFVWLVKDYEQQARGGSANTWLIGNSTLAAGIDEQAFEQLAGIDTVKMPHGSCNVAGYDALLGHYLGEADTPDRLIIFISKDDLNRVGLRADLTTRYLDYASESGLRPSHWLTLSFDREALRQEAADQLDAAYSALRGQATAKSKRFDVSTVNDAVFDSSSPLEEVYNLREAVRGWAYDETSLHALVERARQHGINEVAVVLMPITDRLADMHDRLVPAMPYEQVRSRTRELCEELGVPCLDLAVASGQHGLFYDAFHMNATGRRVITQAVGQWVAEGMPTTERMGEEAFARLAGRVLGDSVPSDETLASGQAAAE